MKCSDWEITQDLVRELLEYDQDTGVFTWKVRGSHLFEDGVQTAEHACKRWNSRYAGTVAGRITNHKYVGIAIFKTRHLAHRLAWLYVNGTWPASEIDHIDLNPLNNAISNLRLASKAQNNANVRTRSHSTLGVKGVRPHRDKFVARISVNRRTLHLGVFNTVEAAHAKYCEAAREHYGAFSRTS